MITLILMMMMMMMMMLMVVAVINGCIVLPGKSRPESPWGLYGIVTFFSVSNASAHNHDILGMIRPIETISRPSGIGNSHRFPNLHVGYIMIYHAQFLEHRYDTWLSWNEPWAERPQNPRTEISWQLAEYSKISCWSMFFVGIVCVQDPQNFIKHGSGRSFHNELYNWYLHPNLSWRPQKSQQIQFPTPPRR